MKMSGCRIHVKSDLFLHENHQESFNINTPFLKGIIVRIPSKISQCWTISCKKTKLIFVQNVCAQKETKCSRTMSLLK